MSPMLTDQFQTVRSVTISFLIVAASRSTVIPCGSGPPLDVSLEVGGFQGVDIDAAADNPFQMLDMGLHPLARGLFDRSGWYRIEVVREQRVHRAEGRHLQLLFDATV